MRKMLMLAAALMIVTVFISFFGAIAETSGTCGDNLTWFLDDNGVLTISGTGEMYDYSTTWSDYKTFIKSVVFDGNATSIGDQAFCECSNLGKH